jgi:hypothetical protein
MPGKGWSFTGKIHQKVCDKAQLSGGRSTRSGLIHQSAAGVHIWDRSSERDLSPAGLRHVREHYAVDARPMPALPQRSTSGSGQHTDDRL